MIDDTPDILCIAMCGEQATWLWLIMVNSDYNLVIRPFRDAKFNDVHGLIFLFGVSYVPRTISESEWDEHWGQADANHRTGGKTTVSMYFGSCSITRSPVTLSCTHNKPVLKYIQCTRHELVCIQFLIFKTLPLSLSFDVFFYQNNRFVQKYILPFNEWPSISYPQ